MLLQRLAEPGEVAVPEDAEAAAEEAPALAVALDLLHGQEPHQRLRDGQPHAHVRTPWGSMSDEGRHRVRAREPRRDVRARRVGEPDRALEVPAVQQPVHERAAERVARAEAADDVDRDRLDLHQLLARAREHALGPALDDRDLHAQLEQRRRRLVRVARADGDLDLVTVADRHGRVPERLARPPAGLGLVGPEHRPVVEVVDGDRALASGQRSQRGLAARLRGQPGAGGPEHLRGPDRVEVQLARLDRHVRRRRLAVEQQREVVRRVDLAEHHRRAQRRVRADPAVVDAEAAQRAAHVRAERIVADLRDHGAARTEPRRGDRDVRRAPAERLRERAHLGERDADLLRVQVDPDAAHRDQVMRHACTSSIRTGRPSRSDRHAARPITSGARASAIVTGGISPALSAAANASHSRT